ncbi:MAG: hypothetical protein J7623_08660 [Chitinophaga sp.]|uniref:LVIVD repeat-containing protein n=1 Tax=Chitinophaga sp. TaxID=1869181 RepID=UPI001AFDFC76|nr:hypothetical protein [Chitinophaga sp.]MBO9728694.1 hypothetical protein [Chitinophaga sp.]
MQISTIVKFPLIALLVFVLCGCAKDKCRKTVFTKVYTPKIMAMKDYLATLKSEAPRTIQTTGKIYVKDNYIFVSDPNEGIHIIDNNHPAAPENIAFLKVMGNVDMAIKGNILYADSYSNLMVFDIRNPRQISAVRQISDAIPYSVDVNGMVLGWSPDAKHDSIVVGYTSRDTSYTIDCPKSDLLPVCFDNASFSLAYNNISSTGKGGSMARFAIVNNYLYTANWIRLKSYDITDPANPVFKNVQNISTTIETLFPYGPYLFIGSPSAMHIYDLTHPDVPVQRSTVTHFRACDPVVVADNKAYVTIRSGTNCGGNINQLQVFDVSNVDNPVKLSTVEMKNPSGLGIDKGKLFICEGTYGLRFLDASDINHITTTKLLEGVDTYDVIPFENQHRLLVSAKDGIYQYDYQNMSSPKLLSKIAVQRH